MIAYMVGKLAPNSSHLTRGLVKYVPGRSYFRVISSQNGDKFVTSPPPPPTVERIPAVLEGLFVPRCSENPKFYKHKEQSPLLIEALLTSKTLDQSTSSVIVRSLSFGFPTSVMESLWGGVNGYYTGVLILCLGLVQV